MFCPRSIYSYWREIWLDKVEERPTKVEGVATTARKVAEPMVVEK
jgi:hypothetical protein